MELEIMYEIYFFKPNCNILYETFNQLLLQYFAV